MVSRPVIGSSREFHFPADATAFGPTPTRYHLIRLLRAASPLQRDETGRREKSLSCRLIPTFKRPTNLFSPSASNSEELSFIQMEIYFF